MKKFIITDLAKGNATITADQVLEIGGENSGGTTGVNNSYSTTETLTGGTWIDGKPIYRRVITTEITLFSNYFEIPTDVDRILKKDGFLYKDYDIQTLIPFTDSVDFASLSRSDADLITLSISTGLKNIYNGYIGYLVIEYTKTTD